jgi:hypothetical protein
MGLEMTLLCREKISCDRTPARIVELPSVRFRLSLHRIDITEVGVGAVCSLNPKTGRREVLSDVASPKKNRSAELTTSARVTIFAPRS